MGVLSRNLLLGLVAAVRVLAGGESPSNPFDPDTSQYCTWWTDYNEAIPCSQLLEDEWVTSLEDFVRWNPSVGAQCTDLEVGFSYCVEAYGEPQPSSPLTTSSTTTSQATTTTSSSNAATTTKPGNGISTPTPIQPGMVGNCNKFYYVNSGDSCDKVIKENDISLTELVSLNPGVGSDCTGLWAEAYVCVSAIGHTAPPVTTTAKPTVTNWPTPVQNPIASNCNKFHKVASSSTTCQGIADYNGIKLAEFKTWNPSINTACSNLKVGYYTCVGILPSPIQTPVNANCNKYHKVSSSSTTCQAIADYNSIKLAEFKTWNPSINTACSNLKVGYYTCVGTLPSPIQAPVAGNCNKYHKVASASTTCKAIADYNGISIADFNKWNPSITSTCNNLWLNYYVCVGVYGSTPTTKPPATTTKAGNGVSTPTPVQANMTKNCKSFHKASLDTTTCQSIATYRGISLANFYKWNPDVGIFNVHPLTYPLWYPPVTRGSWGW